jgi:mono/diheme cytochrome c family protein
MRPEIVSRIARPRPSWPVDDRLRVSIAGAGIPARMNKGTSMSQSRLDIRWLGPALLLVAGCSPATGSAPVAVAANPPAITSHADLVARGEYLVRITGCNDCHTPGYAETAGQVPTDQWLVGSPVGWSGPWGTTYPANLRQKVAGMDEATWMTYTAQLHTRPPMPDMAVRTMVEGDRRAIYRFIHSLGTGGQPAPAYLPPGQKPPLPYVQWVLPPAPVGQPATAAPAG